MFPTEAPVLQSPIILPLVEGGKYTVIRDTPPGKIYINLTAEWLYPWNIHNIVKI